MKELKLIVVIGIILCLFNITMTTGCSKDNKELSFALKINTENTLEICAEKANGDLNLYSQCLDNQIEAMKKLNEYISEATSFKDFEAEDECAKKAMDSKGRIDPMKVVECLGLGHPLNSI